MHFCFCALRPTQAAQTNEMWSKLNRCGLGDAGKDLVMFFFHFLGRTLKLEALLKENITIVLQQGAPNSLPHPLSPEA